MYLPFSNKTLGRPIQFSQIIRGSHHVILLKSIVASSTYSKVVVIENIMLHVKITHEWIFGEYKTENGTEYKYNKSAYEIQI